MKSVFLIEGRDFWSRSNNTVTTDAVVRFAQKIGYSGFSELKYDISHGSDLRYAQAQTDYSMHELGEKIMSGIKKTLDINREEYLKEAVELLNQSNKIVFLL